MGCWSKRAGFSLGLLVNASVPNGGIEEHNGSHLWGTHTHVWDSGFPCNAVHNYSFQFLQDLFSSFKKTDR